MHAAAFQEQYEGVTAFSTAGRGDASGYDPAELVRAAIAELDGDPELLRQERERARWLFVDEYQDTDPAQVELLELLAGGGGNLVAVGDPDQAIYAFRGAEPRGIVEFPDRFRHTDGRPRRPGLPGRLPALGRGAAPDQPQGRRGAARAVGAPAAGAGRAAPTRARPRCTSSPPPRSRRPTSPTSCAAPTCSTALPWSQMAVVVRTAGALGPLRRALASAGVPVAVSADDLPLAGQPAVAPLLSALTALLPASGVGPRGATAPPVGLDEPAAEALLASPLGGATVLDLRRLRRAVRIALARQGIDPAERGRPAGHSRSGDDTLLDVAARARRRARPSGWPTCSPPAGSRSPTDGTAEDVLWAMWQRSGLAARWARASAAGGPSGAVADRDLDAVVALFDAAAGFVDRLPSADVRAFVAHLSAQELPGDSGAARAVGGGDGPAADRARVQGPGVGPRLRRRRPGGRLARPARADHAARHRGAGRAGRPASTAPRSTAAPSPSPRSGGCSTSPAPAPAAGWSSPPSRGRSTAPTPGPPPPASSTWSCRRRRTAGRSPSCRARSPSPPWWPTCAAR